ARGDVLAMGQRIVGYAAPVLAVDGPTGLDLSSGEAHGPVRANVTVTFGGPRRGHLLAREWCGKLIVVDIGLPPPDPSWPLLVTDAWAGARLPRLHATMHKGDRGRVTVVGGAPGMTGAALHAARAAFAAGAGLVKLVGSKEAVAAARASLPDLLTVESALGSEPEGDAAAAICSRGSSAHFWRAAPRRSKPRRWARTRSVAPPSTGRGSGRRAVCGLPTCSPRCRTSGAPGATRSRWDRRC